MAASRHAKFFSSQGKLVEHASRQGGSAARLIFTSLFPFCCNKNDATAFDLDSAPKKHDTYLLPRLLLRGLFRYYADARTNGLPSSLEAQTPIKRVSMCRRQGRLGFRRIREADVCAVEDNTGAGSDCPLCKIGRTKAAESHRREARHIKHVGYTPDESSSEQLQPFLQPQTVPQVGWRQATPSARTTANTSTRTAFHRAFPWRRLRVLGDRLPGVLAR